MTKLILLIIGIILNLAVVAQNFSQEIFPSGTLDAQNYRMMRHNDQHFYFHTVVDPDNDFRNTIRLSTLDSEGLLLEVREFEAQDSLYSISASDMGVFDDGSIIIAGNYSLNNTPPYIPFVVKFDMNGVIEWATKIGASQPTPPKLIKLNDDTFIVSVKNNDPVSSHTMVKVDSDGNFGNFLKLSNAYSTILESIVYDESIDLLFANGNFLNIDYDLLTINWQRKYDHEIGISVSRTSNGDYVFASAQVAFPGYMTVFRTDSAGNEQWSTYLESWSGETQSQISIFDIVGFHFIQESANGDIVIHANSEGGLNGSFCVVLDSEGNYVTNFKTQTFKNRTTVLNNEEYLIGGFANWSSYNTSSFYFERRNLNSAYPCDIDMSYSIADGAPMALVPDELVITTTDNLDLENLNIESSIITLEQGPYCEQFVSVSENFTEEDSALLYPNPARQNTTVSLSGDSIIRKVIVCDMTGKVMAKFDGQGTPMLEIDCSFLEQGVYTIRAYGDRISTISTLVKL